MAVTTKKSLKPIEVPDGYTLLEAGPTRHVGVNQSWLKPSPTVDGSQGPYRVEDDNGDDIDDDVTFYDDVKFLGPVELGAWEYRLVCGHQYPGRTIRIVTKGALLVKPSK